MTISRTAYGVLNSTAERMLLRVRSATTALQICTLPTRLQKARYLRRCSQSHVRRPSRALSAMAGSPASKLVLVVAAALMDKNGRILLAQRQRGDFAGKWEFPGGKVNAGELPEDALARELMEELGVVMWAGGKLKGALAEGVPQECHTWQGVVRGTEGQEVRWVHSGDLPNYDMPAADKPLIGPVQAALQRYCQPSIADAT